MAHAELDVEVVFSAAAREVRRVSLRLPAGSTLADALHAAGIANAVAGLSCGIWSRPRPPDTVLCDGDRVECWRDLLVDPMTARRLRQQRQAPKKKRPARAGRSV